MDTSQLERGAQRVKGAATEMGGGLRSSLGGILGIAAGAAALVGVSLGMKSIVENTIRVNSTIEQAVARYKALGSSTQDAQNRVKNLMDFARTTPFETQTVINAAEKLRLLGGATLDTNRNLEMFGNIAAATGQPLETITTFMGRLYQSIQNGEPIQRFTTRLERMGVLTPEVTKKLNEMSKSHASAASMWTLVSQSAERFNGAMERQGDTWEGLQTRLHRTVADLEASVFRPFFLNAESGLRRLVGFLSSPAVSRAAEAFGTILAAGFNRIVGFVGTAASTVGTILASIPWAQLGDEIGRAWTQMQPLFRGIADAIGAIGPALGRFASDLGRVRDTAASGDWRTAGEQLGQGFFRALESTLSAGGRIGKAISAGFEKTNWWDLSQRLGPHILSFILGVVIQLTDPMNWINLFRQHPIEIGSFFAAIFFAPERFIGPVIRFLGRIPFVGPILEWFLRGMRDIGQSFVRSAGSILAEAFGAVARGAMRAFERGVGAGAQDAILNVRIFFESLQKRLGGDSKLLALGMYEIGRLIIQVFWAGLRTVWPDLVLWAGNLLPNLGDAIRGAGGAVSGVGDIVDTIVSTLQTKVDEAQTALQGIGPQIIQQIGYGIGQNLADMVVGWFTGLPDAIVKAVNTAFNIPPGQFNMTTLGSSIGTAVGQAVLQSGPATTSFFRAFGATIIPAILQGVSGASPRLLFWFASLPIAIGGAVIGLFGFFSSLGINLIIGFVGGLLSRWPVAQRWFQTLQSQILGLLGNPATWLFLKGMDLLNGFFNGITQRWGAVGAWLRTLRDMVLRSIGNPAGWLVDIGSQLFQGLLNGIQTKWNEIIAWIGRAAASLPEPIRRVLGLQSPSRVMMGIGTDTMAGLQIGLERGYGKAAASLTQFAGRLTGGLGYQTNPALALAGGAPGVMGTVPAGAPSGETINIEQNFYQADLQPSDVASEVGWLMKTRRRS